jgi:hypothetical protein
VPSRGESAVAYRTKGVVVKAEYSQWRRQREATSRRRADSATRHRAISNWHCRPESVDQRSESKLENIRQSVKGKSTIANAHDSQSALPRQSKFVSSADSNLVAESTIARADHDDDRIQ